MDTQSSLEQIAGILLRHGLKFTTSSSGGSYRLLFGQAGVFVSVREWQDGVMITVSSPVVSQIGLDGPGAAAVLNMVPQLNATTALVKFLLDDDGDLVAVYDLLGDSLQACELINAVMVVASVAERVGPKVVEQVGGKLFHTLLEEWAIAEKEAELEDVEED